MPRLLLHPRPTLAERRQAWTNLYDGVTEAPQRVSPMDALDRSLQTHHCPNSEPTYVWLKDWSPTPLTQAIWMVFAAFGLPHVHTRYLEWVNSLPAYAVTDPRFARALPISGLDLYLYWLWRGEKWSPGFWAWKVADGTMLAVSERLRELKTDKMGSLRNRS